jgi:peptidoglycan/xylan/chitin deacetylase (PgdA/CDA1 family)
MIPSTSLSISAPDDRSPSGLLARARATAAPSGVAPAARSPLVGAAALVAGAGAAAYLLPGAAAACPALRHALGVEDRTSDGEGFALTFDDGPHARGTPAVLGELERHGARATFFLVGEQVERDPGLAREVAAAGHGIALHCHRHRNLLRLTPVQVREDLMRATAAIERATDHSPLLYRPPYGVLNLAALTLARRRGWRTLLWSHWGRDWESRATAASIAARLTAGPGAVLLLHDADHYGAAGSWEHTVAALPRVLEELGARGLEAVLP